MARSRGYPAESLKESISRVDIIRKSLGGGSLSRGDIADAWKMADGTAIRKVAALVHYGLLSRDKDHAGLYRITLLANKILSPKSDEEKNASLIEAALSPKLFREIYGKYKGHQLPTLLSNILEREFDIMPNRSKSVTRVFRDVMKFVGLLEGEQLLGPISASQDGQLDNDRPNGDAQDEMPGEDSKIPRRQNPGDQTPGKESQIQTFQIMLSLTRTAILRIPLPVTKDDLDAIESWVEYARSRS